MVETQQAPAKAGLILAALIGGAFVANVNLSVANIAVPEIGRVFDASQTELNLVAVGCTLGLAMSVLYLGALGDRFGRKLMLLLGLGLTVPASALCAWAPSIEVLAAGRIATGIAAGMAFPTTLALVSALWATGPGRVRAIALWSSLGGGAAVLGPVIAGALLEKFWWGSVFLIAAPLALVVFALVWFVVPAHVHESTDPVDHLGGVLSVVMVASLVLGLSTIAAPGGLSQALGLMAVCVVVAVLFVIRERHTKYPLYSLTYAARTLFWVPTLAGMIVFGSLVGTMFIGQQFLQNVLEYSTFEAGVAILPAALGMMAVASLASRLVQSRGSRDTMLLGSTLLLIAFIIMLIAWREQTAYVWVGIGYLLIGMGAGIVMAPASRSLTMSVPIDRVGMASGTTDLQRDLGGSIMQALLGSLLTAGYASAFAKAIAGSSEASSVSAQTQSALLQSYSSAETLAQRYPQYQEQIIAAARESFLAGSNWAYTAGVVATLVAIGAITWKYPGKAGEAALFAEYAAQDQQSSASSAH